MKNYVGVINDTLDLAREAITRGTWRRDPPPNGGYDHLRTLEKMVVSGELPETECEYVLGWIQASVYHNTFGWVTVIELAAINMEYTNAEEDEPQTKIPTRSEGEVSLSSGTQSQSNSST